MGVLSNTELATANSILNQGLKSGAKQLSFFMKEDILLDKIQLEEVSDLPHLHHLNQLDAPVYLLRTDIIGEFGGCCFLIFTPQEAQSLWDKALSKSLKEKPDIYEKMKEAILLEVDNIITAAVITEFANILQRNIHGSVPKLQQLTVGAASQLLEQQQNNNTHIIDFKANFRSPKIDFHPIFIWFLDQQFTKSIESLNIS